MVGTDYIKDKYPGDWTDFEEEAFAFNDGKKQAIKEIFEALGEAGEQLLQSDDSFAEAIENIKEEIKQDFEIYA
jgi:hypothetical protein